jgi:nucleoside phosphorylase
VDPEGAAAEVAFVCAMPMEVKPLVRRLRLTKNASALGPTYTGTLGGRRVVAIVTGMGTRLASAGVQRLLDGGSVTRVVVVGITGAVDNETPIGTLVLPEIVVDSATGEEHRPAPLVGAGDAPGARLHGKMWTTDTLITDPDVLAKLRVEGVVSLDMETAAIAAVCERRGVPWSVVRVISDRAGDGSIDDDVFGMSNQDGTPNVKAVIRYFVRHPHHLARMARLAKGAVRATQMAADVAIHAVEEGR